MSDWIADEIYASESRGHPRFFLGSMPLRGNIPTQGEIQREDELTTRTHRLGLLQTIVIDKARDRRFFFASPEGFQRPDVSGLVFGELTTEDSIGYRSSEPMLLQKEKGFYPLEMINRAGLSRLPLPGTEYGACEDRACGHVRCRETRAIAESLCTECNEPIGYAVDYYSYRYLMGERPQVQSRQELLATCPMKYAHASCIYDDTEEILEAPHPMGATLDLPPMKKREEIAA